MVASIHRDGCITVRDAEGIERHVVHRHVEVVHHQQGGGGVERGQRSLCRSVAGICGVTQLQGIQVAARHEVVFTTASINGIPREATRRLQDELGAEVAGIQPLPCIHLEIVDFIWEAAIGILDAVGFVEAASVIDIAHRQNGANAFCRIGAGLVAVVIVTQPCSDVAFQRHDVFSFSQAGRHTGEICSGHHDQSG